MVSLTVIFFMIIFLFGLVGALRGWQKEIISLVALISSIALFNYAGYAIVNTISLFQLNTASNTTIDNSIINTNPVVDPNTAIITGLTAPNGQPINNQEDIERRRQHFYIQAFVHTVIAFFGYQTMPAVAQVAGRLGERARLTFQKGFMGWCVGVINGYLIVGSFWSFLEYRLTPGGYLQLQPSELYPFSQTIVSRPFIPDALGSALQYPITLTGYLPMGVIPLAGWILLLIGAILLLIVAIL
ncbi:MAG TPA: hypothetical protein VLL52_06310 [Anaerolineae bacterium]|nr:hypothetical protein [Anaerolineae bacterium]